SSTLELMAPAGPMASMLWNGTFVTTSFLVRRGGRGRRLFRYPRRTNRNATCPAEQKSFGCDYFSTTPKWLGISGIAGSVGSVGPSKCRAIKIAPGFRSIGACQLLLGQVRKRRSRQSFHPPEKQPQLTILADGVSIERRHFRVEF